MKQLNEKIGYIVQNIFLLSTIINTIVMFCTDSEKKWSKNYEVNGKPNNKDTEGFCYKEFLFDFNNSKLGFAKIILVNMSDEVTESYKFDGFISEGDSAFYSAVDSTVTKGKKNCAYIYVNYNLIADMKKSELTDELTEIIYHELRHYYDNIIGVFTGSYKELTHITLIADELGLSKNEFKLKLKEQLPEDENLKILKLLLYVSQPTELNAWYHSFVANMLAYAKKHPGLTSDDIKTYISNKKLNRTNNEFFVYNGAFMYENLETYKKAINTLCKNDPVKLYYYLVKTLTDCNPSDKVLKAMNNIFLEKYIDFLKDKYDLKIFTNKLQEFFNDRYYEFVYNKISKPYLHTVKNMLKFLATLI